jgi:hypothetical protein
MPLQALASGQLVPSGNVLAKHVPVNGLHVLPVQELPSLSAPQVTGLPTMQDPFRQVSPSHKSPSGHGVEFGNAVNTQPPVSGRQPSEVQGFPSKQSSGAPGAHRPAEHVSLPLQAFASAQRLPSGNGTRSQPPNGEHESTVHGLLSLQSSGVPARQKPSPQTSLPLHGSLSGHGVPAANIVVEHLPVTGEHDSMVHGLPSS